MDKKNKKVFFRSLKISVILLFCVTLLTFGCFRAYEGIRKIGFGEYKNAVEISEENFRIMDFVMFKNS